MVDEHEELLEDYAAYGLDRRELFVQLGRITATLAGLGLAAGCKPKPAEKPFRSGGAPKAAERVIERALQPPQRATLEAAINRILPSDQDPGAREANVIEYVDRELARADSAKLKKAMLAGVVALDNYARRLGGKRFAELAEGEQDDILQQVQKASERGRDFVKFLVLLTIEGFVSDPLYGGNKGGVGWTFIGYGPGNPDGSGTGAHGGHKH